jgi:hypothetical protein
VNNDLDLSWLESSCSDQLGFFTAETLMRKIRLLDLVFLVCGLILLVPYHMESEI